MQKIGSGRKKNCFFTCYEGSCALELTSIVQRGETSAAFVVL
ncbi:hypothetical protein MNBD_ALPHA11-1414 [hydrothermal vent metagenome]|uniref:Uncharacterized protein n=1 Tax=hydrothermal vent metagenome TaxID=652676 RepID=A0A3B0TZX6_9ZZZZ